MKRKLIYLLFLCVFVSIFLFLFDLERSKFWSPPTEQLVVKECQEYNVNNCSIDTTISSAVNVQSSVKSDYENEVIEKVQDSNTNGQNQWLLDVEKIDSNKSEKRLTDETNETTTTSDMKPVTEESDQQKLLHFKRRLTSEQKEKMLDLFRVFIQQMELYNLTYIAYGGTLIGINRHHGIIPWDDDIDVLIDAKQKRKMEKAMRKLYKTHKLYVIDESLRIKWKFFNINSLYIPGYDFKYPYIDIFSMLKNSEDEVIVEAEGELNMDLNNIYPLIKRPFNGLAVYSPCNVRKILKDIYTDFNKCISPYFNHELEEYVDGKMIEVDCQMLKEHYPFVKKMFIVKKNKIIFTEMLIRNGTVLQIAKYSIPYICTNKRSFYPSDLEVTILNN